MAEEVGVFRPPTRQLNTPADVTGKWVHSEGYAKLTSFILLLNASVSGKAVSQCSPPSEIVSRISGLLDQLDVWIDEIPPVAQPMRFGNKAYRAWFARLEQEASQLVREVLGESHAEAAVELAPYVIESFGNATRIDYGTGHELNFIAFLCGLYVLGLLQNNDHEALVLRVFARYLVVVRKLQQTYCMEPAGSHGVWGLDDYQFLPFYFGSSQLTGHSDIRPKDFPNPAVCNQHADEYLFLAAIQYLLKVKKGPFAEHSPMLWDISGVEQWEKVNGGLLKMYRAEVLHKYPVIQHFKLGSLLPLTPTHE